MLKWLVMGFLLVAFPVNAQQLLDRKEAIENLKANANEELMATAVTAMGAVIEVFSSPEGKSWTMILTAANGQSFLIGAGTNWTQMDPPEKGTEL